MTTYKVYNQSCIEGMREHVLDGSVDLIFTDPPYGIDGDKLDAHYHRYERNI
jgi:site-specific DNA-methyltransferase (adenine-specific)